MTSKLLLAALLPITLATAPLAAQTSINLPPTADSARITGFGRPDGFATVGQTFKVPAGNATVLQNFQFSLANGNPVAFGGNGGGLFFRAYLATFDATTGLAGPILFTSPVTQGNPLDTFGPPFNFATHSLALNPGTVYVAFLSTSGLPFEGTSAFEDIEASVAPYADGSLVFKQSDNIGDPFTAKQGLNTAFSAQFSSNTSTVPEPSDFLLVASGLGGLGGLGGIVRLRRRRVAGA